MSEAIEAKLRIHLQWFAAEDEGRTEEPSEHKIKKAREEGRVAKSQDLTAAAGLLLPAVAIAILAPGMLSTFVEMLNYYLRVSTEVEIGDLGTVSMAFVSYFLRLTLPVVIVAVVSAVASNLAQVGFLFTMKPLSPKFDRIVPKLGQFFRKSLFSAEGLFNLAKAFVKVLAIGLIAYLNIQARLPEFLSMTTAPFNQSVQAIGGAVIAIVIEAALALLVLSVPDYFFQRRQWKESLKMTKQEVKEERKMYEGDPMVRGRLRQRMRELLTKNMIRNVPKADVVITNPTHYAVALEWEREAMPAPQVTAKGMDEVALRIRRVAEEAGVPLVENRPLARALYAETEIGDIIPEKYYQAIATVLAYVYKLNEGKAGASDREKARDAS
jgi:flagellar biosynthetic protein FlhB